MEIKTIHGKILRGEYVKPRDMRDAISVTERLLGRAEEFKDPAAVREYRERLKVYREALTAKKLSTYTAEAEEQSRLVAMYEEGGQQELAVKHREKAEKIMEEWRQQAAAR